MLNRIMDVTRAAGRLGIPGLYVTGDPGAVDDAAKDGSLSIRIGLGWAKSHSFTTGQCPVMRYHRGLMQAILNDRVQIAKAVNATVITLDEAPEGYKDFDCGRRQEVRPQPQRPDPGLSEPFQARVSERYPRASAASRACARSRNFRRLRRHPAALTTRRLRRGEHVLEVAALPGVLDASDDLDILLRHRPRSVSLRRARMDVPASGFGPRPAAPDRAGG